MNKQMSRFNRELVTAEDWRRCRAAAERRGHVYELRVKGDAIAGYDVETGMLFHATSDEAAMERAYKSAWFKCLRIDNVDIENGEYHDYPKYVTHPYRLLHQGRLVYEYTPPTPEEVAARKYKNH